MKVRKQIGRPQDYILNMYHKIDRLYKTVFAVTFIMGVIVHGYMLFNKVNFHDDIASLFGLAQTVTLGRWGLEMIFLFNCIFLHLNASMPVVNGLLSLFFIALSACFIMEIFKIKSRFYGCCIGAAMISFPVVASTFCFMFTAPWYFLALLLAVLSAYYAISRRNYWRAALLGGFCLSLYQPYIAVTISICVFVLLYELLNNMSVKKLVKQAAIIIASLAGGAVFWYLGNRLWMLIYHIPDFQGRMVEVLHIAPEQIIQGIGFVYRNFLSLIKTDYRGLSNGHGIHVIYFTVFFMGLWKAVYTVLKYKINIINKVLYLLLLLLLPLAIGFINILSIFGDIDVHTLTLYSYVFIFVGAIISVDKFEHYIASKNDGQKTALIYQWIILVAVAWGIIYYARLDNMAYLKVDFTQKQADSYFTTLVTQIKSVDGYRDDMPVALIKSHDDSYDLKDESMFTENWYDKITIYGADWNLNKWITDYAWEKYINYHCGFAPKFIYDTSTIKTWEEVKEMPCYPDDGSIKVVNDIVVVNFDSEAGP